MYNQQIEELIDAALADGVLTEKEKEILFRKAESMGIDHDEFEMVLDARVTKLKAIAPRSDKMGSIHKCPACGAVVSAEMATCPECGYAFSDISANQSSKELENRFEKIWERLQRKSYGQADEYDNETCRESEFIDRKADCIKSFPVPSTKADLYEFITTMKTGADDTATMKVLKSAYNSKYHECLLKAKSLFPNDPLFVSLFKQLEDQKHEKEVRHKRMVSQLMIAIIIIATIAVIIAVVCVALSSNNAKKLTEYNAEISASVNEGDYEKAEDLVRDYKGKTGINVQSLLDAYMSEGDTEKAIRLVKSVSGNRRVVMPDVSGLFKIMVEDGQHDEAESIMKNAYPDYDGDYNCYADDVDALINFYCGVIDWIATDQGVDKAKSYAGVKLKKFHHDIFSDHNSQAVAKERFDAVLAQYQ